jgi:hypothetical protein
MLQGIRDRHQVDIIAIADDILIAGPMVACREALTQMIQQGMQLGFHINANKSVAYVPNDPEAAAAVETIGEMQQFAELGLTVTSLGITALGVPVGTPDFQNDALHKWLEDGDRMYDGIKAVADIVGDRHAAFLLLKYCYNARIGYLLRCVPPHIIEDVAKLHDQKIEQAFTSIHSLEPMDLTA